MDFFVSSTYEYPGNVKCRIKINNKICCKMPASIISKYDKHLIFGVKYILGTYVNL